MRKPEQQFYDSMKTAQKLLGMGKDFWFQRIENLVGDGMPDVHAMRRKNMASAVPKSFWVELKVAKLPKRVSTVVFNSKSNKGVRISQKNWHINCKSMQGTSYVLAKIGEKLFLFRGEDAGKINNVPLADLERIRLPVYNWIQIFNHWSAL